MSAHIAVLQTTVAAEADAGRLADALLEAGLAACVQIEAIQSRYRWRAELCRDAEWRLTCKTAPDRLPALRAWLAAHHPYEVPELLHWMAEANTAYAEWARS